MIELHGHIYICLLDYGGYFLNLHALCPEDELRLA